MHFEPEMFIFYACEIVDDGDVLKQRLLYALDLYALTADKETAQNIYFTLSKIYHEIGNKDLYDYYLLLTAIKNDETFTYELGSGIIEDWDIQTLKKWLK